jgi:hypothetical protein
MTRNTGEWIKASKSGGDGQCVEMRPADPGVQVRDSKNPEGETLSLAHTGFAAWVAGAKAGEFDHLIG